MKIFTERGRLEELRWVAKAVFAFRNAAGEPAKYRMQVKAFTRPNLREAIHWLRESRDALLGGDLEMQTLLRDRAMMYLMFALFVPNAPYVMRMRDRYDALARISGKGGSATKLKLPKLERQIRACLKRGEPTRRYIKAWAEEYHVSPDTVRRRIREIKAQL